MIILARPVPEAAARWIAGRQEDGQASNSRRQRPHDSLPLKHRSRCPSGLATVRAIHAVLVLSVGLLGGNLLAAQEAIDQALGAGQAEPELMIHRLQRRRGRGRRRWRRGLPRKGGIKTIPARFRPPCPLDWCGSWQGIPSAVPSSARQTNRPSLVLLAHLLTAASRVGQKVRTGTGAAGIRRSIATSLGRSSAQ